MPARLLVAAWLHGGAMMAPATDPGPPLLGLLGFAELGQGTPYLWG